MSESIKWPNLDLLRFHSAAGKVVEADDDGDGDGRLDWNERQTLFKDEPEAWAVIRFMKDNFDVNAVNNLSSKLMDMETGRRYRKLPDDGWERLNEREASLLREIGKGFESHQTNRSPEEMQEAAAVLSELNRPREDSESQSQYLESLLYCAQYQAKRHHDPKDGSQATADLVRMTTEAEDQGRKSEANARREINDLKKTLVDWLEVDPKRRPAK